MAARRVRFGSTRHGACCTVRLRGWAAARRTQVPENGGLTSRSSRCRFAARLNSGVRPLVRGSVVAGFRADCGIVLICGVCTSYAREQHRQSLVTCFGFGQAQLRHKYDHPESASWWLAVRILGRASRATRLRPQQAPAQAVGPDLLYCSARGWVAVLGIGGLTSHSSRCRFAARLNSGVRPQVRRNTGQKSRGKKGTTSLGPDSAEPRPSPRHIAPS